MIGRREFITLLSGVAAWPLAARAQQLAPPVVGWLDGGFLTSRPGGPRDVPSFSAFLQGLAETGYVEGRNVAIEYRWAEARYDLLPAMAAELVSNRIAVTTASEIEGAFAMLVREGIGGVLIGGTAPLLFQSNQVVALAAHQALPAMYAYREIVEAGGLISYGGSCGSSGISSQTSADRVRLWCRNGHSLYSAAEVSGRPLFGGSRPRSQTWSVGCCVLANGDAQWRSRLGN